ncbi:MAG: hypothetical protein P8011_11845, partial [Acidihalobacter sp.]
FSNYVSSRRCEYFGIAEWKLSSWVTAHRNRTAVSVSIACLRNKPGVVEMDSLKIGLIGSGFMGKTHAIAFHALPVVFPTTRKVVCEMVADATEEMARHAAGSLGYRRWTAD